MKNKQHKKIKPAAKKSQGKGLSKKELEEKKHRRWVILVTIATFFSTMIITYISDTALANANLFWSLVILIFIIFFGIISDIIGVAITAVSPQPFNAMAAKKIPGARTAVNMIKNAPRMSNVLNDVIGDICGIVSGATGVSISAQLIAMMPSVNAVIISLALSGCVAAITVGGKAIGKDVAMKNSVKIVFLFAKVSQSLKALFGIKE